MNKITFTGSSHGTINVFLYITDEDEVYGDTIHNIRTFLSQFDVWDSNGFYEEVYKTISWEYPSEMRDFIRGTKFQILVKRLCKNYDIQFEYGYLDELKVKLA